MLKGKWIVRASVVSNKTGVVMQTRNETVDLDSNVIFSGCETVLDIHDRYERFWNHNKVGKETIVMICGIRKI